MPVTLLLLVALIAPALVVAFVGHRLHLPRPFIGAAVVLTLWVMNAVLGRPFGPMMASMIAAAGAGTLTILIWYVVKLNAVMIQRTLPVVREERTRLERERSERDSQKGEKAA